MKTFSISGLARLFGLSRSTLLYYDRLGLLPPSGRTGSGYRYYTEKDRRRLDRIGQFRKAGLTLAEIRTVLSSGGSPGAKLLQRRLQETAGEMDALRNQQRLLAGMLNQVAAGTSSRPVDKQMWVELLKAAGMDNEALNRWHAEFERRSPEGHQEFLLWLGLPRPDVVRIQEWSRTEGARAILKPDKARSHALHSTAVGAPDLACQRPV
jgi:DNA-binding transcriptional MerR regulator